MPARLGAGGFTNWVNRFTSIWVNSAQKLGETVRIPVHWRACRGYESEGESKVRRVVMALLTAESQAVYVSRRPRQSAGCTSLVPSRAVMNPSWASARNCSSRVDLVGTPGNVMSSAAVLPGRSRRAATMRTRCGERVRVVASRSVREMGCAGMGLLNANRSKCSPSKGLEGMILLMSDQPSRECK